MTPREKSPKILKRLKKILTNNGIESDVADTVLQALGYVLFNDELYEE